MFFQVRLNVFLALTETCSLIGEPRTALIHDFKSYTHVDKTAFAGNAFAVHNIEFSLFERRSNFILNDFNTCAAADWVVALFYRIDFAHVKTDGSIEFQRTAARCRFRIAEHHADFFADLVDENSRRAGFAQYAGQFAHRLRH